MWQARSYPNASLHCHAADVTSPPTAASAVAPAVAPAELLPGTQ
jgi:hypothetical protein